MNAERMYKALDKHIDNGHTVEQLISWWNRFTCGERAHIDGQEVVFPLVTISGKDFTQRRPIWQSHTHAEPGG